MINILILISVLISSIFGSDNFGYSQSRSGYVRIYDIIGRYIIARYTTSEYGVVTARLSYKYALASFYGYQSSMGGTYNSAEFSRGQQLPDKIRVVDAYGNETSARTSYYYQEAYLNSNYYFTRASYQQQQPFVIIGSEGPQPRLLGGTDSGADDQDYGSGGF